MIVQPRPAFAWPVRRSLATAAAVLMMMLLAGPAFAQSREEQLSAERAQKATQLHPYEPTTLERRIELLDRTLFTPRSTYLFMGSALEGGGLALGPGFRTRYADTGRFDAHAAWSVRNYKAANAAVGLPTFAKDRIRVEITGNWIDAPGVAFYGVGNNSRKNDRVDFQYRNTTVGASTTFQAARFMAIGGGLDYLDYETGLSAISSNGALNPNYRRSRVFAEIDSRTSPDYARSGGLYRVEWSDYRETTEGRNSFQRVDAEAQQFVPLMRENWVIALRALASTTTSADGEDVPYFLMPELGGSHMLRGYPAWRFRDRNRLLFTGEYRWTAGPFVDMAVFVDAGKVAQRRTDLDLQDLKTSHGVGLSIHTAAQTIARIEFARSHEGTSVSLSFSPSF